MPYGIISSKKTFGLMERFQICSVQTLVNRLDTLLVQPDILIFDEAHHALANTWKKIIKRFPNALSVGLTATPERTDGQGLDEFFDEIVLTPPVRDLIEKKYLANYIYYPGERSVHIDDRSTQKSMDEEAARKVMIGDVYEQYTKRVKVGEKVLMFAPTIEKSKEFVAGFRQRGVAASHLDGKTPMQERELEIEKFSQGLTAVLSNVGLFSEGFDSPDCKWLFMCNPTKSHIVARQCWGRVLRSKPDGGYAGIIDFVENHKWHGYPDDLVEWSLSGKSKQEQKKRRFRECLNCGGVSSYGRKACPYCGHKFPLEHRRDVITSVKGNFTEHRSFYDRLLRSHDKGRVSFCQFWELNRCNGNPLSRFDEITIMKQNKRYGKKA